MASSDNLMAMEPWASWVSDVFTRETETLSKVLQNSVFPEPEMNPVQTSTGSGRTFSGGSENETTTGSNRRSKVGVSGKITKRKSRASRRNTTTYITADVDNFRHMVQQVTGVRFSGGGGGGEGQLPVAHILKPEPQRVGNRLLQPGTCLPTLDTSAFLLDPTPTMLLPTPPSEVGVDGGGSCGYDFSSFSGFPTLESFMESNVV